MVLNGEEICGIPFPGNGPPFSSVSRRRNVTVLTEIKIKKPYLAR
jgi:hypothetical protein